MQASIFGQVPIGNSVIGYYSREKESISIDQMRNKIIGAIKIYNYGSLRKQLLSPEKNNQFSELKYQNQGFELLRQRKIDLFLMYLNHEVKEDISDLYPHKLKQHKTYFVVSKKNLHAQELLDKLDHTARKFLQIKKH